MKHYLGTLAECEAIDATITTNCGWPAEGTIHWADPRETVDTGVYAIEVPEGSHGFTKEQMTVTITAVEVEDVEFPIAGEDH